MDSLFCAIACRKTKLNQPVWRGQLLPQQPLQLLPLSAFQTMTPILSLQRHCALMMLWCSFVWW